MPPESRPRTDTPRRGCAAALPRASLVLLRQALGPEGDAFGQYLLRCGFIVDAIGGVDDLPALAKTPDLIIASVDAVLAADMRRILEDDAAPPVVALYRGGAEELGLRAIEAGAADCFPTSGRPRELLARVRAILRRLASPAPRLVGYRFDGCVLDLRRRQLHADGGALRLSNQEFSLLLAFVTRPGAVLTREDLIQLVMGQDADVYDRAVDCLVSRLRRKLVAVAGRNPIRTLRAAGYRFEAEVSAL